MNGGNVSKCGVRVIVPWVQIPLSPPNKKALERVLFLRVAFAKNHVVFKNIKYLAVHWEL